MAAEPRNHRHPVPATPGAVSAAESAAFAGHAEPIALDMPDGAVAPESPLPPPEELQGWWQDVLVYVVLFVISLAGVVLALRWLLKYAISLLGSEGGYAA